VSESTCKLVLDVLEGQMNQADQAKHADAIMGWPQRRHPSFCQGQRLAAGKSAHEGRMIAFSICLSTFIFVPGVQISWRNLKKKEYRMQSAGREQHHEGGIQSDTPSETQYSFPSRLVPV
jgi:hypothetical protein